MNDSPYSLLSSRGRVNLRPYFQYVRAFIVSLLAQTVKGVQHWVSKSTSSNSDSTSSNSGHRGSVGSRQSSRRSLLTRDLLASSLRDTRACRYQFTNDHVLLEADQVICASLNSGFCQHARCLLEGSGSQEAIGIERSFGDAQQHCLRGSRFSTLRQHASIGIRIDKTIYQVIRQHLCIAGLVYFDAAQHLANDDLNVFITDIDTCIAVHALHFFDHIHLDRFTSLDAQDILRVALTTGNRRSGLDLLTIGHYNVSRSRDGIRTLLTFLKANRQYAIRIDIQLTLCACHHWYWLIAIFSRHHRDDLIFLYMIFIVDKNLATSRQRVLVKENVRRDDADRTSVRVRILYDLDDAIDLANLRLVLRHTRFKEFLY